MVEHFVYIEGVIGSSPISSTKKARKLGLPVARRQPRVAKALAVAQGYGRRHAGRGSISRSDYFLLREGVVISKMVMFCRDGRVIRQAHHSAIK